MLKNSFNRITGTVLAMIIVISCISMPDVYSTYEIFTNKNTAEDFISTELSEETSDDTIYSEDIAEPITPSSENEVTNFEYDGEDFSVKAKIDNKAVFSLDNETLNADDVLLSVTAIDETDERFEKLHMAAADDEHSLLLYDIGFYTESGEKADVSECDAQITFYFDKPYAGCKDKNLSVVKFIEISTEADEGSKISFECSETEIIGSTYVNDELIDVTFHVDSLTVYGIILPVTGFETNALEAGENLTVHTNEGAGLILSEGEDTDEGGTSQDIGITINIFTLELTNGAEEKILNDNGDKGFVWTADKPDEGHGFTYGLAFNTSGEGYFAPGEIEICIPKHILKDKDGNYADEIYLPYPEENEEYDADRIEFVYREEDADGKEQIVIYNVKQLSAGQSMNIPFMYETTEKTWEYVDMAGSDACKAYVKLIKKSDETIDDSDYQILKEAYTNEIPVYIDTSVQINSTSKLLYETMTEWSESWGTKPEDDEDYIYFIWKIGSSITNITQKYNFQIKDIFNGLTIPVVGDNASPEVIGYRMQGSSKYVSPDDNGSSPMITDLTASSRTDYVLTRCLKSAFEDYGTYELSNNVTATVIPADGEDAFTFKEATAIGKYEKIEPPEPTYSPPGENYKISKYGIYGNKQHVKNSNNISSYDLDRLKNGNPLPGLTYHIQASANAYIKTLADGAKGTEEDAKDGKFGQKNVTYSLSDSEIYLEDLQDPLSKDDYTFTSLEYSTIMQNATYNSEIKSFNVQNVTEYESSDLLQFYVMKDENAPYTLAAVYDLSQGAALIVDSSSVSSLTGSSVTFKNGVEGWKIETSNPYYSVSFNVYPTITLHPTETVKNAIPTTNNAKISVKNNSTMNVIDSTQTSISRSASGTDYVAKVQRNSNISKKVVSAKNYPGIRGYKVNWETSMSETYTDESGISPIRQESGVFYDLIPMGCRVDLRSVKVYADGVELLESEYTIDDLQENYKNSNRTLLTVRINTPAEKDYSMTYTTVHLWEDVLDYGRYVLNSVAYETGNPDIANGYPDNGGNISDSTILADLDPETNNKRFLYSQATHTINALIPLSSGITKKVASADDASFRDKTIVHQNSSYVYSIRMENASHSTSKNIVIFDSLENFCNKINGETGGKECDWRGTLESFGLANLERLGINPVIYLSSTPNLNLAETYSANDAGTISFNSDIWTKLEDFGDISTATAFAIDLSQGIDGTQFELGENRSFSFTVTMRSPQSIDSEEISPETYNNIYRSFISTDTETSVTTNYYDHQDYTTVIYRTVGDLRFQKINSKTSEPIQGIKFNLSGTSFYGTAVDKELISDSNGIVYFADLERGTYLLTETDPTVDFLKGKDRIVEVDKDGNVTMTSDDEVDGVPVVKNDPRIRGDLNFLKMDALKQSNPVIGAVFTLTGISDYGNKIEKTAVSDDAGVFFEDVEKGTYTLTEISAPSDYTKLKDSYTVVCSEDGILSIVGLSLNSNGDYVITNMPRQEFNLIKLDSATESKYLQGAVFHLKSTATQSGEVIDKDVVSRANGIAYFYGLDLGTYTLTETTAPESYYRDTKAYTVVIALNEATKEVSVTITDPDGNQLQEITVGDTTGFKFTNEAIPENITIVKKWEGDTEADRPPSLIIHLSTEKPEAVQYKATIDSNTIIKNSMSSNAIKLLPASKDTVNNYTLQDLENMKTAGTAWIIGTADKTNSDPDKQKDVYLYQDSTDPTVYYYWSEAQTIYLPTSCNQLFSGKSSLTEIDLSELNSSKVTDMQQMFRDCTKLESLNLSSFDTSNVTNMRSMFYNCSKLSSLNLSNFNTSNVGSDDVINSNSKKYEGSMYQMFLDCSSLTSLDLSSFDTSNAKTMEKMFEGCTQLHTINFGRSFELSNVTTMERMFYKCYALTNADFSTFGNAPLLENIKWMFIDCRSITTINLSNFTTSSKLNTMERVFKRCYALTSIDISNLNTSNVKIMLETFYDCTSLISLDLSSFDTSNVTTMEKMFGFASANNTLTTIYVSNLWSTASITNRDAEVFYYCNALVGEKGTAASGAINKDSNRKKVIYARIDNPPDAPGYFTYRAQPSSTSSSATEKQVTSLFNSVSKTVSAYKAVANASLMALPTLMYASETTTPTQTAAAAEESTSGTSGTGTSEKINYDTKTLKIEPTKVGNTWTYVIPVHDADVLYYVWEETVPNGYISDATKNEPKKVNAPEVTRRQTITNTKTTIEKGNLTLSKTVTKGGIAVADDTTLFTFKITISGDKITENQYFDAYTFIYDESTKKASAEVTLKHGESITISGIPVGTLYTIQETSELYGYTSVTPVNASGTIVKDTTASVEWENQADNRATGEFHVSKTVELYEVTEKLDGTKTDPVKKDTLTDDELNQEFTFTAVLTKLDRSGIYTIQKRDGTQQTFTSDTSGNATVTFILKHDETVAFTGIPIGATYQITETSVEGYTTFCALRDANSQNNFVSPSGESETDVETLDSGENVTATFTNSKTVTVKETVETMDITAEKQWEGDNEADRPKSITVYLERCLVGFPNNAETVDTATITPHNLVWKTEFTDLPKTDDQGRTYVYSIREESVAGYTCVVSNPVTDEVTGNQKFTVTNTKIPTYDLTINKTVEGAFGNKAKQFEFNVTLKDNSGNPLNGFYTLKREDNEILVLFDIYGQAKIGVSHGEEAVIKNLPEGTQFTVTETDYSKEGYTTKSGLDNSSLTEDSRTVNGILNNGNKTAFFVNSRAGILPTGVDIGVMTFAVLGAFSLGSVLFVQRKRRNCRL